MIERIGPLLFNPLVPDNLIGSPHEPPSPDFAIRFKNRDIFCDVTVLRHGTFNKWDRAASRFANEISRLIKRNKIQRIIYLDFPFSARNIAFSPSSLKKLINEISVSEKGQTTVSISSEELTVAWELLPHVDSAGNYPKSMTTGTKYATSGPIDSKGNYGIMIAFPVVGNPDLSVSFGIPRPGDAHHAAAVIETRLVIDSELNNLLLKSIRNTLKRKRAQFSLKSPFILIIKPGHRQISNSVLVTLLKERIWPNNEYSWISGVCLFTPRTFTHKIYFPGLQFNDSLSSMVLLPNSYAATSLPKELVELFEFWRTNYLDFGERIITLNNNEVA